MMFSADLVNSGIPICEKENGIWKKDSRRIQTMILDKRSKKGLRYDVDKARNRYTKRNKRFIGECVVDE